MDYLGKRLQRVSPALLDHLKRDSSPCGYSYVLPVTSSLHKIYKRTCNGEAGFVTADLFFKFTELSQMIEHGFNVEKGWTEDNNTERC
jgi:hypothetical protein